jgi:hypothetical protein
MRTSRRRWAPATLRSSFGRIEYGSGRGSSGSLGRTSASAAPSARSWAYDSPEFERRKRLLEELGEFRRVSIRFVVESDDFSDDSPLSWRAVELEGGVPARRLAPLLARSPIGLSENEGSTRPSGDLGL